MPDIDYKYGKAEKREQDTETQTDDAGKDASKTPDPVKKEQAGRKSDESSDT